MERWGRAVGRRAGWVLAATALLAGIAGWFGAGVVDRLVSGGFDDPAAESSRAAAVVSEKFAETRADVVVLYSDPDLTVDDTAFAAAVGDVVDRLDPADVVSAATWWSTESPALVSPDRHTTQVVLRLVGEDDQERLAAFEAVREDLEADGLTTRVGGQYAVFDDVNEQVGADIARAESIALPIVFLLSLVVFGSVVAALMPTLIGGIAVLGAFAVVRLITGVTDVSVFAINVITLLGMGLAIDYALFVVSRFRDELARSGGDRVTAMGTTMATAGRTVFFSGTIVAASLASLLVFPQTFLTSMGWGGMAAVLVAMTASLTVLPAVLVLLGHRVEWGTMPWRRRAHGREAGAGWARLARSVMRRPVLYLVAVTAALLVLASPFLDARWGSVDERVLPADSPSRVAADAVADELGTPATTASVVLRGADDAAAREWAAAAADLPGVDAARPIAASGADRLVEVAWSGGAQDEASQELVRDLRGLPAPDGVAEVLVGGPSAATVDLVASIGDRLPWMAALVVAVMLVLLFVAFGSVLLPIKAVVVNALSLTASFGVVTWIFQDGHLSDLLGFTPTGYLDVTQPILMLAILFGLSMDYEVFLLSRVREAWDRTHHNTTAVVEGVRATGRIITSAALLLAVVIGGFASSGIVFLKMIGVGMLVAVLLDATVVRGLLVPATMRLLGRANWWAPAPLARWWERHGHREPPALGTGGAGGAGEDGPEGGATQQLVPSSGTVPATR